MNDSKTRLGSSITFEFKQVVMHTQSHRLKRHIMSIDLISCLSLTAAAAPVYACQVVLLKPLFQLLNVNCFCWPRPLPQGMGETHWSLVSLVTSHQPAPVSAPGPRLLSPRAPAPGHHDTHHVTCDNVMSVTWLRWELGMSWHWRAACGHSEQEPGGTRSRLRGALACRARGHRGRHWESVSHLVSSLVITNNEAVSRMARMAIWPRQWNFKYIPTPSGQLIFWAMLVIR